MKHHENVNNYTLLIAHPVYTVQNTNNEKPIISQERIGLQDILSSASSLSNIQDKRENIIKCKLCQINVASMKLVAIQRYNVLLCIIALYVCVKKNNLLQSPEKEW